MNPGASLESGPGSGLESEEKKVDSDDVGCDVGSAMGWLSAPLTTERLLCRDGGRVQAKRAQLLTRSASTSPCHLLRSLISSESDKIIGVCCEWRTALLSFKSYEDVSC